MLKKSSRPVVILLIIVLGILFSQLILKGNLTGKAPAYPQRETPSCYSRHPSCPWNEANLRDNFCAYGCGEIGDINSECYDPACPPICWKQIQGCFKTRRIDFEMNIGDNFCASGCGETEDQNSECYDPTCIEFNLPFAPKQRGYIIQLKEDPIIISSPELNNQLESLKMEKLQIEEVITRSAGKIAPQLYSRYEQLQQQIPQLEERKRNADRAQLRKIVDEHNNVKARIIGSVAGKIAQSRVLNEFRTTFNGIALDITKEEAEQLKQQIPEIKAIYPNSEVQAFLMDSIPLIKVDAVWRLDSNLNNCIESNGECLTGKDITIGIIDTGVDYTHPDLGSCTTEVFLSRGCSKVIDGYDFVNNDNDPMDDDGHGTHVASIAAGNGILKGVAPDAKIVAYKVLDSRGYGNNDDIIAAIERAVDPNQDGNFEDHLDIISMSLGGFGYPNDPPSQAVDNIVKTGVVAVIASGNSGPEYWTVASPGTARKAITVGATYKIDYFGDYWEDENPRQNQITSFSSRGPTLLGTMKPDLVAPGALICAARYDNIFPEGEDPYYYPCIDEYHVQFAGTSMATPIVSGTIALIKQAYPYLSPEAIKALIKQSTTSHDYDMYTQGSGIINALQAVQQREFVVPEEIFLQISKQLSDPSITSLQTEEVLTLWNLNSIPHQYNLVVSQKTSVPGVDITLSQDTILVYPYSSSEIFLTLYIEKKEIPFGMHSINLFIQSDNGNIFNIPILIINEPPILYKVRYANLFNRECEGIVSKTRPRAPYPNPFSSKTSINYRMIYPNSDSIPCFVLMTIYDSTGSVIGYVVSNSPQSEGEYTLTWYGTDIEYNLISNGIYFFEISAKNKFSYKGTLLRD